MFKDIFHKDETGIAVWLLEHCLLQGLGQVWSEAVYGRSKVQGQTCRHCNGIGNRLRA